MEYAEVCADAVDSKKEILELKMEHSRRSAGSCWRTNDQDQEGKHFTSHLIRDILRQVGGLEENVILMGWLILHGINYIPTKYIFQNGPKNVNKNQKEIEGEKDREDIHKKKVRLSSFADCL